MVWRVSKVDSRYALLLPTLAELRFVIEKTQLLSYIVHDQVRVYLRLAPYYFLICLA